ncbi:MAG: class II SORL domain-containing protein [Methanosarcinaceae archaeon]|nr:class II SORL domain-containing protein [Methanosarcinaceae archaeon]
MTEKGFFNGINRPLEPSNLTEMEMKHLPVIETPDTITAGEPFDVTISVGNIPHVMEVAHHIQWVDLYLGENFITKVLFTPVFTRARATITIVENGDGGTAILRAVERCNVHGIWENTKDIAVKK